ncbi:hypothetical protein BCR37DRAFT_15068 [Protomyces lactucae-debilis]|uniref:Uncharacterized protein n=1 Tax=Protomyces lactucae-debilis TaxID=2754530 RepID=A0A1Y2FV26_PROLT|nr:uncharacterized protein BCR37DRAFT_15068 [Protomyces lactucae-debilis]ORY87860.1 hypothetical protein BCR37DRAFT_15068 [Protomyces lactucae-debilis]
MHNPQLLLAVLSTVMIELQATTTTTTPPGSSYTISPTDVPSIVVPDCIWRSDPADTSANPPYFNEVFTYFRIKQPTKQFPDIVAELESPHLITVRRNDPNVAREVKTITDLTYVFGPSNLHLPQTGPNNTLYGIDLCQAIKVKNSQVLEFSWGLQCLDGLAWVWRFHTSHKQGSTWLTGEKLMIEDVILSIFTLAAAKLSCCSIPHSYGHPASRMTLPSDDLHSHLHSKLYIYFCFATVRLQKCRN